MDRKRAKELAPVIKAFGDGEDIEYQNPCHAEENMWWDVNMDSLPLGDKVKLRIKPKPREFWINLTDLEVFLDKSDIPENHCIKVIEVIE